MFIYGIIPNKALISFLFYFTMALLIVPFKCSLNLSCESICIPSNFWHLFFLFQFSQYSYSSLVLNTCKKVTLITVTFHLVISKPPEQFSRIFLKQFNNTNNIIGCNKECIAICVTSKVHFVHVNKNSHKKAI